MSHSDIPIVFSPNVPQGTFYLVPNPSFFSEPIKFRPDVWGPPSTMMSREARLERLNGLSHLERLLDRLCERWGMDPNEVWREPRLERRRKNVWAYIAEERIAMMVNSPLPGVIGMLR